MALLPVLVLSLPFLFLMVRAPVLRRLALRNATRRPRETALVLLGSLLGTAIITGSLIVGNTLGSSIRQGAYNKLGPVDEVAQVSGLEAGPRLEQAVRAGVGSGADVDGVLPFVGLSAAVGTARSNGAAARSARRAEPHASVYEVDFDKARAFGGDAGATGISGPTPAVGHAVIGRDLARTLQVGAGETVTVFAYGQTVALRVDRVLARTGIAGLDVLARDDTNSGGGSEAPTVFVAPGTIAGLFHRGPAASPLPPAPTPGPGTPGQVGRVQAAPPTSFVAVSNRGGVLDGARPTHVLFDVSRAVTEAGLAGSVVPAKADLLKAADASGKQFTQLFTSIGFFSVIAGILLLVNIFVMLAQERKTEMGMLRAVGLRRASLVGSFSLEGWLYALASSFLGMLAGLGVGRLIVLVASGIFGNRNAGNALELRYHASVPSVLQGFAIGFVISLVTVVLTSLFVARLNVIRAIRDLPEPVSSGQRRSTQVLGALGVVAGGALLVSGLASATAFGVLAGPALLALGLVPLLRGFVPRRALGSVAATSVLVWAIAAFSIVPKAFRDSAIGIFVVQGVVLTAAAVCLITINQDAIGAAIRRIGGGSKNMSLRLGLAYPLARRFRTGMILASYALVVFTLTFITVFSHLFSGQVTDFTKKISGGFAVRVASNASNPVPLDELRKRPDVAAVSGVSTTLAEFQARSLTGTDDFVKWPGGTFDRTYVDQGAPALHVRAPQYADDAAAYRAVLAGEDLIIPSSFFLQSGGGPPKGHIDVGQSLVVRDPLSGRTRTVKIAAIAESGFGNALAVMSPAAIQAVFGPRVTPNVAFIATKTGVDPDALASSINGTYLANGADATSFRKMIQTNIAQQQQFFHLMQGYLALGLVVGIAGLGVVMVRAVRERRRQVGVLRSLGFSAVAVRRAFVAESAFVALEGITIGVALACVTAWRLVGSGSFGQTLHFSIPVPSLVVLVAGTAIASLLATAAPAQQASKIRPAVALRTAD